MSANVILAAFGTDISCSQVSSDGYEASNLVSSSQMVRLKGFLAERFIKPPVNIFVKFKYPLELSHIVLNARVGSQKSLGFEVYSQINQAKSDVFYPLAKKMINNEENQLTFINPNFVSRAPFTNECKSEIRSNSVKLRHNLSQALTNVSVVQIRITRTLNSCIPALGKLEVWAQPSRSCSKDAALTFYKIYKSVVSLPVSNLVINQACGSEKEEKRVVPLPTNEEIPSEFIDPISCEIMVLPVLLPSGHCVDRTTLDKYLATEASWGRSPNDPFTGVQFSSKVKPLPNSALKGRIDEFLINHQHFAKDLPRTTGKRKRPIDDVSESSQREDHKKRIKFHKVENSSEEKIQNHSSHEKNLKDSLDSSLKQILNSLPSFTKNKSPKSDTNNRFSCVHQKTNEIFKLPCSHLICRLCLVEKKKTLQMHCNECKMEFNSNGPLRIFL